MKKYKFITIEDLDGESYDIRNKEHGHLLGFICFHREWKRWTFSSVSSGVIWSTDYLYDVINFIENEIPK